MSRQPTADAYADDRPRVPYGPGHHDSAVEPDEDSPTTTHGRWLLKITVSPPAVGHWENQWRQLHTLMSFDRASCTWSTVLGAIEPAVLKALESCLASARDDGAHVRVEAVPAPAASCNASSR